MRELCICILFLGTFSIAEAQGIEATISFDGELSFSFNASFIQEKNVSRVDYSYSSKKPNRIINPEIGRKKFDIYNRSGRVIEHYSIREVAQSTIEKHQLYTWDNNQLLQRIEKDYIGYYKTCMTTLNDTICEQTYRALHYNPDYSEGMTEDSTLINTTYYVKHPNEKRIFNKNRIHIRTLKTDYDSLGLKRTETMTYKFSNAFTSKVYGYNEDGYVSEIVISSSTTQNIPVTYKFYYNQTSNLERVEQYKDGILITEHEVLYREDGWVDAILEHHMETNVIFIQELEYLKFK